MFIALDAGPESPALRILRVLESSPSGRISARTSSRTVLRAIDTTERLLRFDITCKRAEELWRARLGQPALARAIVKAAYQNQETRRR